MGKGPAPRAEGVLHEVQDISKGIPSSSGGLGALSGEDGVHLEADDGCRSMITSFQNHCLTVEVGSCLIHGFTSMCMRP